MKKRSGIIIRTVITLAVIITGLALLQRLLMPKYVDGIVEGAFVKEYYQEEKDHDVLFIGDCEVYENFSPKVLWEKYGINSYIRGSAEQYIFQSYYLLEDALRYETPKVVVFNIQSLQFNEAQSEAYNRMSIEGMRWSPSFAYWASRAKRLKGASWTWTKNGLRSTSGWPIFPKMTTAERSEASRICFCRRSTTGQVQSMTETPALRRASYVSGGSPWARMMTVLPGASCSACAWLTVTSPRPARRESSSSLWTMAPSEYSDARPRDRKSSAVPMARMTPPQKPEWGSMPTFIIGCRTCPG